MVGRASRMVATACLMVLAGCAGSAPPVTPLVTTEARPSVVPSPLQSLATDPVRSAYLALLHVRNVPLTSDSSILLGCIQEPTEGHCATVLPLDEGYLGAELTALTSAAVPPDLAAANQTLIGTTKLALADENALGKALGGGPYAAIAAAATKFRR